MRTSQTASMVWVHPSEWGGHEGSVRGTIFQARRGVWSLDHSLFGYRFLCQHRHTTLTDVLLQEAPREIAVDFQKRSGSSSQTPKFRGDDDTPTTVICTVGSHDIHGSHLLSTHCLVLYPQCLILSFTPLPHVILSVGDQRIPVCPGLSQCSL